MTSPRIERLTGAECRHLLPGAPVGRLAVPGAMFPSVEPVSFALVDDEVVVAVRSGSAGDAVTAGSPVAFEADVLDRTFHQGWTVVVRGVAEELAGDPGLLRSRLSPWPPAAGDRLLRIAAEQFTGRRIVVDPEPGVDEAPAVGAIPVRRSGWVEPPALVRSSIGPDEGLALLAHGGEPVGRLVVAPAGIPHIYPLNYGVDDDAVVFRTQVGSKLTAITRSMATFEVDQVDASGVGWSVVFEGLAQEILDADPAGLRDRIAALEFDPWPGGERAHYVRITPYSVSGTRWAPVTAGTVRASGPAGLSLA